MIAFFLILGAILAISGAGLLVIMRKIGVQDCENIAIWIFGCGVACIIYAVMIVMYHILTRH